MVAEEEETCLVRKGWLEFTQWLSLTHQGWFISVQLLDVSGP